MKPSPQALATWITIGLFCGGACFAASVRAPSWNRQGAADYLDQRAAWWASWPGAARDNGTFCVSCHTALPYALARPALGRQLAEKTPPEGERKLLESVVKRVRGWNEVKPFYNDRVGPDKSLQSRGTESVLNALILAMRDKDQGKPGGDTRMAFQNMWATQTPAGADRGSWPWLDFGNRPFEANDSVFYGACLAAVAAGAAREEIPYTPDTQAKVKMLVDYIGREYQKQSVINQAVLLWSSAELPGLLARDRQTAIVDTLFGKQQADGGWVLSSLAWSWEGVTPKSLVKLWVRSEDTPFAGRSDGYATGFIAFALEKYGVPRDNQHLQRALDWLVRNQKANDGRWVGYSPNHGPEPSSPTGLFMSDAATAYSVLALIDSGR